MANDRRTVFDRAAEQLLSGELNRDDELVKCLMEGSREDFEKLAPEERQVVTNWLSSALADGHTDNAIHNALWDADYLSKPVSIEEFIEDDNYLGSIKHSLYPIWKKDLSYIFSPKNRIYLVVLTGAIGTGKTTAAAIALLYKIYQMSCLRNPAKYYNLLEGSRIAYGIYSITLRQVGDTGYDKFLNLLDCCPYFKQTLPRDLSIKSKVRFMGKAPYDNHRMEVVAGSRAVHSIGQDLYSFLLDEANFLTEKKDKERGILTGNAYEIYDSVMSRLASRFMRAGGAIPGIGILMSSKKAQTSFLQDRLAKLTKGAYKEGQCGEVAPGVYVADYSRWDVEPDRYKLPPFSVQVGSRLAPSRILMKGEVAVPGTKVIKVPGDWLWRFQEDIEGALRDVAGVATFGMSPLIHDRQSIFDACKPELKHPFTMPSIVIDDRIDSPYIQDYVRVDEITRIVASRRVPRLNPLRPRFMHIDGSLSGDSTGIAMGHPSSIVRIKRPHGDGTQTEIMLPYVIVDFMLRVRPPANGQIDMSKIRSFVLWLREMYSIMRVTYDGYQSADACQILSKAGVESGVLSVDRDDEAYLFLRSAFREHRVACYSYEPFIGEVLDLEHFLDKKKVDHPLAASSGGKGSKDVSDGVAGVIYHCMTDPRAMDAAVDSEMVIDAAGEIVAVSANQGGGGETITGTPILVPQKNSAVKRLAQKGIDLDRLAKNADE